MTIVSPLARSLASPLASPQAGAGGIADVTLCGTTFSTWIALNINAIPLATDPNGGTTAFALTDTIDDAVHQVYNLVANATTKISVLAKAGTANFIGLSKSGGNANYAVFNLATGAVASSAGGTASITPIVSIDPGWYLVEFTPDAANQYFVLTLGPTASDAIAGTSYIGALDTVLICSAKLGVDCVA